jgi:hypothetical protein
MFGIRLGRLEYVLCCAVVPRSSVMGHPDTTVRKLLDAMALMEKHLTAVLASR